VSAPVDVVGILSSVAGASNEIFRLAGSDLQKDAAKARDAVAELIDKVSRHIHAIDHPAGDGKDAERQAATLRAMSAALAKVQP